MGPNPKVEVISKLTLANQLCETILEQETTVGLDCEGINLGHSGKLTLIQIVNSRSEVFIFDIWMCPQILEGKLRAVLQSPDILKIIHDGRNDRMNLKHQFGIHLESVFDTQVAHSVAFPNHPGRIGWNTLCQKYQFPQNPLKKKFSKIFAYNHAYLKKRPMPEDMIKYATADVLHLHYLYRRLNSQIKSNDRERFEVMCRG